MRDAFATSLIEIGRSQPDLFVLDADCSHSTRSYRFGEANPERFLNVGIAEQNMMSMAAGLALQNYLPFACGFAAIMVARAGEQIIQSIAYPNINVKIAGHYAGVSASREGAPHHAIADLAFLRALPNMQIFSPADDADVPAVLSKMASTPGPAYLRLSRDTCPPIAGGTYEADGHVRTWGGQCEVALLTTGAVTAQVVEAAQRLRSLGISASPLSILQIKPFPEEFISAALQHCTLVVTVEEHSVFGGLGSATAEVLSATVRPIRLLRLGVQDRFTETGSYGELLDSIGISSQKIVDRCLNFLNSERRFG